MYLKMVNAMARNTNAFTLYDTIYCTDGISYVDFRVNCIWGDDLQMKLDWTPLRASGDCTIGLNYPATRFFTANARIVYFDRANGVRINYSSSLLFGQRRTNEFGNFYIKENDILKASGTAGAFPVYTNYFDICLSRQTTGDYMNFHSLEISGTNTQNMIIKPARDIHGIICLVDTISWTPFYVSDPTKQQYLNVL